MRNQFPNQIKAGLSLSVLIEADEYPAPKWSALAILRGPAAIDLQSKPEGTDHAFVQPGADTSQYAPGIYSYSLRIQSGANVHELEAGTVEILPDLAASSEGHDPRTHAQKVLESIEAVIEKRATRDQQSYQINGRSLQRTPIAELLSLRDRYRKEVKGQKAGKGKRRSPFRSTVKVRM